MNSKKDTYYANTHSQLLTEHLFAVGYIAQKLFCLVVDNDDYKKLSQIAFLAGCLHDIGKVDPLFQAWLKKNKRKDINEDGQHIDINEDGQHIDIKYTFDIHPRHNETSLLLFCAWENQIKSLSERQKEQLEHLIYWHHAKPYRTINNFNLVENVYEYLSKNLKKDHQVKHIPRIAIELIEEVTDLAKTYTIQDTILNEFYDQIKSIVEFIELRNLRCPFPDFKTYKDIEIRNVTEDLTKNAYNNVLRACVISADRLVSALSANDLSYYISEKLLDEVISNDWQDVDTILNEQLTSALKNFPNSKQTKLQNQKAQELADCQNIAVLAGPAGCGKTRIALKWANLKQAKKIIWVCPRVQICQGIFTELTENYLPNTTIEIFTGEFKYTNNWQNPTNEKDYFSSDIVVTTIDQLVSSITSHTKVDALLDYMTAHIVFDEYHEYVTTEIFNLLFAELVIAKDMRKRGHKNILLVSATPHYLYLQKILNIDSDEVIEMVSFNESSYQIRFKEYEENELSTNPFFQFYSNNTFIISNTATTAQLGFILNQQTENSVLFHSKFKCSDKKYWFNQVNTAFCENGTKQYQVLRSGPIVQASLNISCDQMLTEMSNAENILQRLGRLDRFGKKSTPNILTIAITDSIKKGKCLGHSAYFLSKLHSLQSSKVWYNFLQEKLINKTFKLPEIYHLYKSFYVDSSYAQELQQDLEKALSNSIQLLNKKVTEPIKIAIKKKTKLTFISKHSLRGDNRFVQMALIDIENYQQPEFINRYAYQMPEGDEQYDNLTESLSRIKDLGLTNFMAQKHNNIDATHPVNGIPNKKQIARLAIIENYARNPEYPIYLSYTEDDLVKVGGTSVRNPNSFYYVICKKQPIGSMAYEKIQSLISQNKTS